MSPSPCPTASWLPNSFRSSGRYPCILRHRCASCHHSHNQRRSSWSHPAWQQASLPAVQGQTLLRAPFATRLVALRSPQQRTCSLASRRRRRRSCSSAAVQLAAPDWALRPRHHRSLARPTPLARCERPDTSGACCDQRQSRQALQCRQRGRDHTKDTATPELKTPAGFSRLQRTMGC